MLRTQRPYLLIGSPMCTAFSAWQALNNARSTDRATIDRLYAKAVAHIDFVVSL